MGVDSAGSFSVMVFRRILTMIVIAASEARGLFSELSKNFIASLLAISSRISLPP